MKKFNFIYLFLAFVGVLAMTSCEHKYADYTPGAKENNMGVYFPSTKGFTVTADATSVDITVARLVADEAATIKVRANEVADEEGNATGLFTLPESVSFEAGETEATYTISFDGSQLEIGREYAVNVKLDQTQATSYAISEHTFTIIIPEPWSDWGPGIYVDDFWRDIMALAGEIIPAGYQSEVQFQKHDDNPKRIRVVNPASIDVFANMWGGAPGFFNFDDSKDYYLEFDITDSNNVKLAQNPTMLGLDIVYSDGPVPACLFIPENEDGSYIAPITLVDGIIRFPQGQVLMGIIDAGALYMATGELSNVDGMMMYITPGTELTDYSMTVAYAGMKVSADNTSAKALIEFAFGEDVEEYAFTIADGDITADFAEELAAVIDGTDEEAVKSSVEQTNWEIDGLAPGLYTIVAVPYAGGEAKTDEAIAYNFYFNGLGDMPEVNVDVEVGVPSQLVEPERAEEVENKSPACFSLGVKITADASQLKAIKYFVGNGPDVDAAIAAGKVTMNELFAGNDASDWIKTIAEKGSVVGSFSVIPSTTATVFLRFETIYGTKVDVRCEEYTVPAYDGDFPVGTYKFTEGKYEQTFSITPAKSYTTFIWHTFDENEWHATYDPETKILSMDGNAYGYEAWLEKNNLDSLYGIVLQYDDTTGISYVNRATADAEEMSDVQVQVGENGLEKLLTYYSCHNLALDAATGKWGIVSSVFEFTPAATIAPYVEEQPEQPEAQSLSATINAESYAVEAKRVERGVVIKPYYGKIERNFQLTTLQR